MKFTDDLIQGQEYCREIFPKVQVVLHHSASESVRYLGDWWRAQKGKIATAYAIEGDGSVFRYFAPCYWAYHTGNGEMYDRFNIGIELANVGYLRKNIINGASKYFWEAPGVPGGKEYKGEVITLNSDWRGFMHFAAYDRRQVIAAGELVKELCRNFGISREVNKSLKFDRAFLPSAGIVNHHNVNPGKYDPTPAFDYRLFEEVLNG
ncbi:MAG: N-acetylmuramoyl-L-alanine amidase [Ignavibacteriaceae bacterium]|nr:N-acetylmuramoyl-L-alanine amidase [Ignavibacteriaceae bacterium]